MLQAFEDAFVALATDAALRRRFAQDPAATLAALEARATELGIGGLHDAARAALRAIPADALDRYARSLVAKRGDELARVVPLALRVAPSLRDRHRAWALTHPVRIAAATGIAGPTGIAAGDSLALTPGAAEGLRALAALHAQLVPDEREAPYAADLFAFEVLRAASRCDGILRGLRSRWCLDVIAADVERGLVPTDPETGSIVFRFERRGVAWQEGPRARGRLSREESNGAAPVRVSSDVIATAARGAIAGAAGLVEAGLVDAGRRGDARRSAAMPLWLGAGIGYRRAHHAALIAGGGPRVLEILPDHFFANPGAIEALADRYAIVFHDVGLSLGTVGPDDHARARLARIKTLAQLAKPVLFSDHLALTRSAAGTDLGHLAPIWRTERMLDHVADRVRAVTDVLGVPVALENIAAPFEIPGGMPEAEFFTRLVERTGCGVLLDLTNLLGNAYNHGFDARERLRDYPLAAVQQVHLAGGFVDRDRQWIDSHSEPVEPAAYALLAELAAARPVLRTIVIERDDKLGALAELVAEADRAQTIWEGANR